MKHFVTKLDKLRHIVLTSKLTGDNILYHSTKDFNFKLFFWLCRKRKTREVRNENFFVVIKNIRRDMTV